MFVMIDNYDSFVYVLNMYFEELEQEIIVVRNDEITIEYLEALYQKQKLEGIIISPGPKSPKDSGMSVEIVQKMGDKVPILGVCLGHQVIGYAFGGSISKGKQPMHGKVTPIKHNRQGIFDELPQNFEVTRYHSLVVDKEKLPKCLQIDAQDEDGTIMAISHINYPLFGIQFHPEAVLTEYGHEMLENYIKICRQWWRENENTC